MANLGSGYLPLRTRANLRAHERVNPTSTEALREKFFPEGDYSWDDMLADDDVKLTVLFKAVDALWENTQHGPTVNQLNAISLAYYEHLRRSSDKKNVIVFYSSPGDTSRIEPDIVAVGAALKPSSDCKTYPERSDECGFTLVRDGICERTQKVSPD